MLAQMLMVVAQVYIWTQDTHTRLHMFIHTVIHIHTSDFKYIWNNLQTPNQKIPILKQNHIHFSFLIWWVKRKRKRKRIKQGDGIRWWGVKILLVYQICLRSWLVEVVLLGKGWTGSSLVQTVNPGPNLSLGPIWSINPNPKPWSPHLLETNQL